MSADGNRGETKRKHLQAQIFLERTDRLDSAMLRTVARLNIELFQRKQRSRFEWKPASLPDVVIIIRRMFRRSVVLR